MTKLVYKLHSKDGFLKKVVSCLLTIFGSFNNYGPNVVFLTELVLLEAYLSTIIIDFKNT